jgi:hypothetical protein
LRRGLGSLKSAAANQGKVRPPIPTGAGGKGPPASVTRRYATGGCRVNAQCHRKFHRVCGTALS